jgi:hypothetical protein
LLAEISDYPDLNYWQLAPGADQQSARPER